jgi:hypothetical protein
MTPWRKALEARFPRPLPEAVSADSANSRSVLTPGEMDGEEPRCEYLAPATQLSELSATGWDTETAKLITWFLGSNPPAEPLQLHPGVWIAKPSRYWELLKADIAGGPKTGRAMFGAFQKDLRRLEELFGQMEARDE